MFGELDRASACALVKSIAREQGFIEEKYWLKLDADSRETFEYALKKTRERNGHSITTLAKNIYSSKARFVFELLQNADDNHFDGATQDPYVCFKVYRDRIVVECNEDGFTGDDLRAICDVGKSSKIDHTQGYIGEKGIGFKSVFMVARKVHIHSRNFSFFFDNRPEDHGMGMICPIWKDEEEYLPLTRITLELIASGSELPQSQHDAIRQQLIDLDDKTLLFLKKLRDVTISFFDDQNHCENKLQLSKTDMVKDRVTLIKRAWENGEPVSTQRTYHVLKHTAKNIAGNENRSYSKQEKRAKVHSQAEVMLAFPMSEDSIPMIEPQDVFAFLPMTNAGFSFIIQSDFVTEANRQGIVTWSQRNIDLLTGISEAFILAVRKFCQHPKLQYTWVKYLPNKSGHHYDTYWSKLVEKIEKSFQKEVALRAWSSDIKFGVGPEPGTILELLQIPPEMQRAGGEPLLQDDPRRLRYLSLNYQAQDVAILRNYGLRQLTLLDFAFLISTDLGRGVSRMKSEHSSDDWHSRVAKVLIQACKSNTEYKSVKNLALIPLQSGRWVDSRISGGCYFSRTAGLEGIEVPQGIGLNLIHPLAELNSDRSTLFKMLGAQTAEVDFIRERILTIHRQYKERKDHMDVQQAVSHLKFLYLSESFASENTQNLADVAVLFDDSTMVWPWESEVYLPTEHEFEAKKLLAGSEDNSDDILVTFLLHTSYLENTPPEQLVGKWQDWLCSRVGVEKYIQLIGIDDTLGTIVHRVATKHPEKLLGFLSHNWERDGRRIEKSDSMKEQLGQLSVPCESGRVVGLNSTYLPIPDLKEICSRFLREGEYLNFLQLHEPVDSGTYASKWGFLVQSAGVSVDDDIDFYINILKEIRLSEPNGVQEDWRIVGVYSAIQAKYSQLPSGEVSEWKDRLQSVFEEESIIYVPSSDPGEGEWARPDQCLWDAPDFLTHKHPLHARFSVLFASNPSQGSSTRSLFQDILGIGDFTWQTLTTELRHLREQGCEQVITFLAIYATLERVSFQIKDSESEALRNEFYDDALIYVPGSEGIGWHKVSGCLWSSETKIRGKAILDTSYDELYDFFVDTLNVDTLDLRMVFDDLIHLGSMPSPPVQQILDQIWVLNSLIENEDYVDVDPLQLINSRIFPVKFPGEIPRMELVSTATNFAIGDRTHLRHHFQNKVKILDFSFEKVHSLSPFWNWTRLSESRYLSGLVRERSNILKGNERLRPPSSCIIRPRAHALCRIAFHYKSPRTSSDLYHLLRNVQIFETDGILCEYYMSQDGREVTSALEQGRSDLHIKEDYGNSTLQIFVPRDRKRREFCYSRKLPDGLLKWLLTNPNNNQCPDEISEKAHRLVATILSSSMSTIYRILEEDGVAFIDLDDSDDRTDTSNSDPEDECESVDSKDSADSTLSAIGSDGSQVQPTVQETTQVQPRTQLSPPNARGSRALSPTPLFIFGGSNTLGDDTNSSTTQINEIGRPAPASPNANEVDDLAGRVGQFSFSFSPPSPDISFTERQVVTSDAQSSSITGEIYQENERKYQRLLETVVRAARIAPFPTQGSLDLSSLLAALPTGGEVDIEADEPAHTVSFRSKPQIERDKMIGAAGELYVYELLKTISPMRISMANWESTIRHYVAPHRDYAEITRWIGKEKADIIYEDAMGHFTRHLIDHGYLASSFGQRRPKYLLEIKSTTGSCETPFYMSRNQYRRMHEYHQSQETVYMIFRVFDLSKNSVGLRIYADPAELELSGQLIFTAGTCSVVPKS